MKKLTIFFGLFFIALGLVSCSDDDNDGLQPQSHDDSALMTKMHEVMADMNAMNMTNDPDLDFANMMIMHHQGAIEMANYELQNGSDTQMKAMAQSIIDTQQQEIQQMQAVLNGMAADETDTSFAMELMMSMEKMDTTADTQLITGNVDHDFAKLMIVHHQAALDNASAYLHHGGSTTLTNMANMMVEMQNQEIIDLANWLLAND